MAPGLGFGQKLRPILDMTLSMAGRIDSSGEIETLLHNSGGQSGHIEVGDRVALVFRSRDEPDASVGVTITSPSGQKILDRVVRELPTGQPQSAPPIEFVPATKGSYVIEVRETRGKQRGTATLKVG